MVAEIILREYLRCGGAERRVHAERACKALHECLGGRASDPEIHPSRARDEHRARLIRSTLDLVQEDDSLAARYKAREHLERSW